MCELKVGGYYKTVEGVWVKPIGLIEDGYVEVATFDSDGERTQEIKVPVDEIDNTCEYFQDGEFYNTIDGTLVQIQQGYSEGADLLCCKTYPDGFIDPMRISRINLDQGPIDESDLEELKMDSITALIESQYEAREKYYEGYLKSIRDARKLELNALRKAHRNMEKYSGDIKKMERSFKRMLEKLGLHYNW